LREKRPDTRRAAGPVPVRTVLTGERNTRAPAGPDVTGALLGLYGAAIAL